jgi:hypothetical protein
MLVTPAPASCLVRSTTYRSSPIARWLDRRYERGLRRTLARPAHHFAAIAAVLVAGAVSLPDPVPENREPIRVTTQRPPRGRHCPRWIASPAEWPTTSDRWRVQNVPRTDGRPPDQVERGFERTLGGDRPSRRPRHDARFDQTVDWRVSRDPRSTPPYRTNDRDGALLGRTHAVRVFGPDLAVRNQRRRRSGAIRDRGRHSPRVQSQRKCRRSRSSSTWPPRSDWINPETADGEARCFRHYGRPSMIRSLDVVVLGSPGVRRT